MIKSAAFQRSVGIFQGGGVRGAAFAGAYKAVSDAGINLVATAGTSSGSISAALIAAGLDSDEVLSELDIQFSKLLVPSEYRPSFVDSSKQRLMGLWGPGAKTAADLIYTYGRYSTAGIQEWLERILKRKLHDCHDPVQFRDLPKHLAIVATDLTSRGPKVWSRKSTSHSPVALAVSASCAIPFFFEPVTGEASYMVDGGLIGNVPAFLVNELELEDPDIPVLCFLLEATPAPWTRPKPGLPFAKQVIDATLNGVSRLHLDTVARNHRIYCINIPTGQTEVTDFWAPSDVIGTLISAGKSAVDAFIRDEQVLTPHAGAERITQPLEYFRERLLERTAQLITESLGDVWVLSGDLSWFRELHLVFLKAVLDGRSVRILVSQSSGAGGKPISEEAVQAASAMGCDLVKHEGLIPIKGTIVSPNSGQMKMILREREPEVHGRLLQQPDDSGLLSLILKIYNDVWDKGNVKTGARKLTLEPIPFQVLKDALQAGVTQYHDLTIKNEDVPVDALMTLTRSFETFKLVRLGILEKILSDYGVSGAVRIPGSPWPITPPVVERTRGGKLVVIDGAHRVFLARRNKNIGTINVVLVENPAGRLPAVPTADWDSLPVFPVNKPREERYERFILSEFRTIRDAFDAIAVR